jgi:predicted ATPase
VQYLAEQHPERLERIVAVLRDRVPGLGDVDTRLLDTGHLLLQVKDAAFKDPVQARFVSDGTLKLLAYLTVLYDPEPPPFVGIEEPENFLYPEFLEELAGECRSASDHSQVLVTTHSPWFVNACRPEEVRVIYRGKDGYARVWNVDKGARIKPMIEAGAQLGQLWMEGHIVPDDPLKPAPPSRRTETSPPTKARPAPKTAKKTAAMVTKQPGRWGRP